MLKSNTNIWNGTLHYPAERQLEETEACWNQEIKGKLIGKSAQAKVCPFSVLQTELAFDQAAEKQLKHRLCVLKCNAVNITIKTQRF